MKIPKSIKIFGQEVKISEVENLVDQYGTKVDGEFKPSKNIIFIDKKLKGKERVHTFLHEYNHAVVAAIGAYNCNLSSDLEEIIVDAIAKSLSENFILRFRA